MTISDFRKSKGYADSLEKIRNYSSGFEFTIPYYKMPTPTKNGMRVLLADASNEGLIECISIGYSMEDLINSQVTEETWRRK